MLNMDKKAIERALDRCSSGGSDNEHGERLDEKKFRAQAEDYIKTFVADADDAEDLYGYVDLLVDRENVEEQNLYPDIWYPGGDT